MYYMRAPITNKLKWNQNSMYRKASTHIQNLRTEPRIGWQSVILYSSVFIRKLPSIQLPGFAFRESEEDTTVDVYRSNPPWLPTKGEKITQGVEFISKRCGCLDFGLFLPHSAVSAQILWHLVALENSSYTLIYDLRFMPICHLKC